MQNVAQSKAENLNSTIAKSAPGMVLRSQGKLSKRVPTTPTTASSKRSTTITSATTASRSTINSTATATFTTKPTRQKKLLFADDSEFKVHIIDHHTTLRAEDKDYDNNNFTTAEDASRNSEQQVVHNMEAQRRGLYIGDFYARVPESEAEEAAQACVWEVVERALRINDLVHSLSESTMQLSNIELLDGLRASVSTIAAALDVSLHHAYAMVAARSAHLLHIGYTEAQLRAFVAKSNGNFSSAATRAKMEHAFEAAAHIVQQILAGIHICFLQIIVCAQYMFMSDNAICNVLLYLST